MRGTKQSERAAAFGYILVPRKPGAVLRYRSGAPSTTSGLHSDHPTTDPESEEKEQPNTTQDAPCS